MALFWAKALPEAQTVMIPAKIRPRFSIGEYSFSIVSSPAFVAKKSSHFFLVSTSLVWCESAATGMKQCQR
jgi:hypothetical protein